MREWQAFSEGVEGVIAGDYPEREADRLGRRYPVLLRGRADLGLGGQKHAVACPGVENVPRGMPGLLYEAIGADLGQIPDEH